MKAERCCRRPKDRNAGDQHQKRRRNHRTAPAARTTKHVQQLPSHQTNQVAPLLVETAIYIPALNSANMALSRHLGSALHVALELVHVPETAELGLDKPGRSFERVGSRRCGYETVDLNSQKEERLIMQCVSWLSKIADRRSYWHLRMRLVSYTSTIARPWAN